MTAQELNTYIDKVLGNSLRCLLPSYWWKRILSQIVGYVEVVDKKLDSNVNSLNDKIDNLDIGVDLSDYATKTEVDEVKSDVTTLNERIDILDEKVTSLDGRVTLLEKFAKSRSWIAVTTDDTGSAIVYADGETIEVAANTTKKIHFINSFRIKNASSSSENVIKVDAALAFTSNLTSMASMFNQCSQLNSLDLSSFDTSSVTFMGSMFIFCDRLKELNLSSFDTSNVRDMNAMFYGCYALTSLDLSNFDTSNVTDMNAMFAGCTSLTSLTLGSNFFKMQSLYDGISFSSLANWSSESAIQSLVTNSYDRTSNGLSTLEIKLHPNVYAYLTDEHKATLTTKGYTVVSVE
jgi:surface protein